MNTESIKAIAAAAVVIIVAFCGALGIDLDASELQNVLSAAIFLAATAFGCWKNFNISRAAQEGQKVTNAIKRGEMELEE